MQDFFSKVERLVGAIDHDVNGIPGMPLSGNGGLISNETIKACDEVRLELYRARRTLEDKEQ